ncbi:dynein-related subfamily AAA family protein [Curtobacterium sp. PhB142]|nr:dynein-related subfamily AAA family protein [Curtobacterium sp. PhB142]TCM05163.1 dynein-related subfamily AAA family protein [Curtobacterium sp. PhB134]
MSTTDFSGRASAPAWLTPSRSTNAERLEIARRWQGDTDRRFTVSVAQLRQLIGEGFRATPRFQFKLVGLPGGDTEFNAWCRKLGREAHQIIAASVSAEVGEELETYSREVGSVTNWTDGFSSLFEYLSVVNERTTIDVDALQVVGRPGAALQAQARGLPDEAEVAERSAHDAASSVVLQVHEMLGNEKNVIVEGVAGSGKSHLLEALRGLYEDIDVIVFHPSTSYEEFVSGLRPTADGRFTGVPGVFVRACQRAAEQPHTEHLLFIDEINRANTAKVFGDLLLPMEKSKRCDPRALGGHAVMPNAPEGVVGVTLQTALGSHERSVLVVPDNLHILGTMNSTDRSVGSLDLALRRRFAWLTMEPLSATALRIDLNYTGKIDTGDAATRADWDQVVEWYDETNETLLNEVGPDARLGHAYIYSASTPRAAAQGLLGQLAEIAFTFNLAPERLDDIPAIELSGMGVSMNASYRGKGLGRRPSVSVQQLVRHADGRAVDSVR